MKLLLPALLLAGAAAKKEVSPMAVQSSDSYELMALNPRDISDYKMARFVLFATVDGDLQARDRNTGALLWSSESSPLIQVEQITGDQDGVDAVWITELTDSGRLLYFDPVIGLEQIPASIKDLVERTPYALTGNIVYTGSKHTVLYAIDAESGEVMHAYGSSSPLLPTQKSSRSSGGGLVHLGRTEYTLEIHEQSSARAWRLKFTRWEPNLRDADLERQYQQPLDGLHIASISNTTVMAVEEGEAISKRWTRDVGNVVKVFDVLSDGGSYVVLPQPPLEYERDMDDSLDDALYVDVTANGDFYALGNEYQALIVSANKAAWCSGSNQFRTRDELASLLRGVHPTSCRGPTDPLPQVEAPPETLQLPAPPKKWYLRVLEEVFRVVAVAIIVLIVARQDWFPELFSSLLELAKYRTPQKDAVVDEQLDEEDPHLAPLAGDEEKPKRKRGKRGGKKARDAKRKAALEDEGEALGPLWVSSEILGYGSHGTTVLRGRFQNREVAIKRMLLNFYETASREIQTLQESDDHKNVVRYYCKHETDQFLYIALELCPGTLEDLLHPSPQMSETKCSSLQALKSSVEPLEALKQIVEGVNYLHSLKIVHRDLKPQNILVANPKQIYTRDAQNNKIACLGPVRLLISDFGLCKKLDSDQSSFHTTTAAGAGTSGWTAPEISMGNRYTTVKEYSSEVIVPEDGQHRRLTRAVDIFSLGCVFYYVLSAGQHPFGESYMRQPNIENSNYDVSGLDGLPYQQEATDLIESMIRFNPLERPDTQEIAMHPLFWTDRDKLDLLVKVSDRLEHDTREEHSDLLEELERHAPHVVGADWHEQFPQLFIENLGKYRKYHGDRIIDLLRALRNKLHHYNDFSPELKECVGPLPSGYLRFFTARFPDLFMVVYRFAKAQFSHEDVFIHYFTAL